MVLSTEDEGGTSASCSVTAASDSDKPLLLPSTELNSIVGSTQVRSLCSEQLKKKKLHHLGSNVFCLAGGDFETGVGAAADEILGC